MPAAIWNPLSDYSSFARRSLRLWPEACQQLLDDRRLETSGIAIPDNTAVLPEDRFNRLLRECRQTECLRIAWREVSDIAMLEETLQDLSSLADGLLQITVEYHWQALQQRFGEPLDEDAGAARFAVLGMGKLGGRELNFSSDIDVLFIHAGTGRTTGPRRIDSADFFTRLARAVIHSLDSISEFGQVYRVDTRLRPYGSSGRLVWSTAAMEQYYLLEGRDWERYALLKARPVAGDQKLAEQLLRELQPFVYRRYLDYGLFAGVRQMRNDIARAAARRRHRDNLKIGPGGIRELEFLVHSLQLLRGGQQPGLRDTNLLRSLRLLHQHQILEPAVVKQLEQAYRLLRRAENALQMLDDQQTHDVPDDPGLAANWTKLSGFDEPLELNRDLQRLRGHVAQQFDGWFGEESAIPAAETIKLDQPLSSRQIQQLLVDQSTALEPLLNNSLSRINKQSLTAAARARLENLLPQLLRAVAQTPDREKALQHGLRLLESIAGRSNYLALLLEQPQALARMLDYGVRSDFIAVKLQQQPALLDELIDPVSLADLPASATAYQRRIGPLLNQHQNDPEQQLYRLQYWRQSYAIRIAANELLGHIDTPTAQQQLSWLAETVISSALQLSSQLLGQRSRQPVAPLTVIAYGTLGAREMHHTSDLDLVFLYSQEADNTEYQATRLAQKFIHLLTSLGPGDRLYEIDTRLRPNGRSGALVSSLRAFQDYQQDQAWVWEWQALCRARCIHGQAAQRTDFQQLRQSLLRPARPVAELTTAITDMHQRITSQSALEPAERLRLKTQFLTQFWLLSTSLPDLPVPENLLEQLDYLAGLKPAIQTHCEQLAADWRILQDYRHHQQLNNTFDEPDFNALQIDSVWHSVFG